LAHVEQLALSERPDVVLIALAAATSINAFVLLGVP